MKLCKVCFPVMAENIQNVSKVTPILAKDHEECQNCGFCNIDHDSANANLERLRATDANLSVEQELDNFILEGTKSSKKIMSFKK